MHKGAYRCLTDAKHHCRQSHNKRLSKAPAKHQTKPQQKIKESTTRLDKTWMRSYIGYYISRWHQHNIIWTSYYSIGYRHYCISYCLFILLLSIPYLAPCYWFPSCAWGAAQELPPFRRSLDLHRCNDDCRTTNHFQRGLWSHPRWSIARLPEGNQWQGQYNGPFW